MGEWTNVKIEVSYGPAFPELGKPSEPMRGNDGSFILMGGDQNSDDRKRIAVVDFHGKAKRGELYRAPDPEGLANAHRLAACWNVMDGIEDPAATMKEVREVTAEALQWMEHVWERDNAGQCCSQPMAIHDLRALLAKLGGE